MGLFTQPYGEISDAEALRNSLPRKGITGFFETIGDYLFPIIKANLLLVCCLIPTVVLFFLAWLITANVYVVVAACLLSAPLVGAGLCGLHAVVCESIRNRGFVFREVYRRHFKENLRRGIFAGALFIVTLLLTLLIVNNWNALARIENGTMFVTMLAMFVAVSRLLLTHMLPMMILVDMRLRDYVKNSMLLMAAFPKASVGIVLTTSILYVLTVLFLPYTLIYVVGIGFAIDALIGQLWSWPILNQTLSIEEREEEKKNPHKED